MLGGSARASAPGWTIQSSPNVAVPASAQLTGVACPSASRCFAVGELDGTAGSVSLIEQWNGTDWSVVDAPDPSGTFSGRLAAISCADGSSCFAVGGGLIKRWDGVGWSSMPFPQLGGTLTGVSCPTATMCIAVGIRAAARFEPVIARWNGTEWSLVATPELQGEYPLNAVSCPSVNSCFAVGEVLDAGEAAGALVVQWDGNRWSRVQSPEITNAQDLFGVTCPSVTRCFAVGSFGAIEQWDGASWTDAPGPPFMNGLGSLMGVSCPDVSYCFAVGLPGYVVLWDGTSWSLVEAPAPDALDGIGLFGVACVDRSDCFAAGNAGQYFETKTRIERWNGDDWSPLASPTPSPTTGVLSAVTCRNADRCVAVGRNTTSSWGHTSADAALIERWNGTRWSIDAVPGSTTETRRLAGVVCANATRCFAVGTRAALNASSPRSLLEQWNGRSWSIIDVVTQNNTDRNELFGTTCANEARCFAVGYQTVNGQHVPSVQRFNGTKWSFMASPSAKLGSLFSVSCPSATICFAVGYKNGDGTPATLIEQWVGGKWSVLASPPPTGARFTQLAAVACPSVKRCFAVGRYTAANNSRQPLVEQWNGKGWQPLVAVTPPGATKPELSSVACPSITSCTAVGRYTIDKTTMPLVERWNGTRWTIEANAAPADARSTLLSGVACTGPTACVAVGNTIVKNVQKTFVERHR